MYKFTSIFCLVLLIGVKSGAQQQTDTVKCYVQIMIPAAGTIGMSRNIEDNMIFINGGMLIYTKAYAISEGGKYIRFLTPKRKELKNIWKPKDPEVMEFEW